jgi:hypothetical protein
MPLNKGLISSKGENVVYSTLEQYSDLVKVVTFGLAAFWHLLFCMLWLTDGGYTFSTAIRLIFDNLTSNFPNLVSLSS